jgi:hypothetical protein
MSNPSLRKAICDELARMLHAATGLPMVLKVHVAEDAFPDGLRTSSILVPVEGGTRPFSIQIIPTKKALL